ncbi:TraR/DksA C4-type zinc finger protein [Denitromonas halophila]|uniref:RNA polymerase-binding protein DksA n=1 Tax=Denitromonas halophila TaxID=1629404 RepID=A0A557QSN3_9RHOO|nr:TraR/DksA C4-type zinc finger protein [Denitromonas halophila]TVO55924.1 RNA polymerase-binding protein DksA [Denitromonas halophila]
MQNETSLLASGEDEYMNEEQLAFFRARLERARDELQARPVALEVQGQDLMAAADPTDRATMEEERTATLMDRQRQSERLREIAAALRRIEEGEYGYCEATGEPIGLQRLLAYPTARLSLEAQHALEHTQRFVIRAA